MPNSCPMFVAYSNIERAQKNKQNCPGTTPQKSKTTNNMNDKMVVEYPGDIRIQIDTRGRIDECLVVSDDLILIPKRVKTRKKEDHKQFKVSENPKDWPPPPIHELRLRVDLHPELRSLAYHRTLAMRGYFVPGYVMLLFSLVAPGVWRRLVDTFGGNQSKRKNENVSKVNKSGKTRHELGGRGIELFVDYDYGRQRLLYLSEWKGVREDEVDHTVDIRTALHDLIIFYLSSTPVRLPPDGILLLAAERMRCILGSLAIKSQVTAPAITQLLIDGFQDIWTFHPALTVELIRPIIELPPNRLRAIEPAVPTVPILKTPPIEEDEPNSFSERWPDALRAAFGMSRLSSSESSGTTSSSEVSEVTMIETYDQDENRRDTVMIPRLDFDYEKLENERKESQVRIDGDGRKMFESAFYFHMSKYLEFHGMRRNRLMHLDIINRFYLSDVHGLKIYSMLGLTSEIQKYVQMERKMTETPVVIDQENLIINSLTVPFPYWVICHIERYALLDPKHFPILTTATTAMARLRKLGTVIDLEGEVEEPSKHVTRMAHQTYSELIERMAEQGGYYRRKYQRKEVRQIKEVE